MSDYAVKANRLSKKYYIGARQQVNGRLSDRIGNSLKAPFRRIAKIVRGEVQSAAMLEQVLWALKDITFSVSHGEVVGVIGANGAGKSTLLKILSRITDPTGGYVDLYGRVGSLLEVGTGFHPELTGRENIYLNGAILGMRRSKVKQKFDEIVDFSGIERFIDTPIKHYSSGMYVRLAFAVAAHLEPEILIVDEVLAVGDLSFQKKCLGKMEDAASSGRTVLFVSHNMGLIHSLCQRCIFLKEGRIMADGSVESTIQAYLKSFEENQTYPISERTDRKGKGDVRLIGMRILDGDNQPTRILTTGDSVRFEFQLNRTLRKMTCNFSIFDQLGRPVARYLSSQHGEADVVDPELGATFVCEFDEFMLLPGSYRIDFDVEGEGSLQDSIQAIAVLSVNEGIFQGRRMRQIRRTDMYHFYMPHRWKTPLRA
jgi:lipopolysaccharide transport system ATP-binding protein